MKRILISILMSAILFSLVIIPISAVNYDDQVAPCFNNTMQTTANFNISSSGVASVNLSYIGHPAKVTDATIRSYVQKSTSSGWVDVSGAAWVDEVTGITNTVQHTVQLTSRGTYRMVYEFEIRGTGGPADIVSDTIVKTY